MSEQSHGYQRLFAELKRRKVFRVMAVYGIVGFIVLQVVDLAIPALLLPNWTYRFVALLLLAGFPVAIVLAWAFEMTPEGVRRTEAPEPGELEGIVAQPPSKRWPAGVLALIGAVALLLGAGWVGRQTAPEPGAPTASGGTSAPVEASIAVLPFADMSPAGDQEYFSDGISEELLNLLAKVPQLRVAARTSSFAFEDDDLPVPVIADSLNVAFVLEGSVRKADDEIRVTAQLIRAEDGYHEWSDAWDRTLEDVFAIQDEIAADVVDNLKITLLDQAPTVRETDPEAYGLVLQARHLAAQRTRESVTRAEELYREALAIDSTYAPAWSGLAANYQQQAGRGWRPFDTGLERARRAAEKALALDSRHAEAHSILGLVEFSQNDLSAAARHHEEALALKPGDARVVGTAALTLVGLDRLEEAVRLLEYRVARDPVSVAAHVNLALTYMGLRRWTDAIESLRTALSLDPAAGSLHALLGMALLHAGEPDSALAVIQNEPSEAFRLIAASMAHHAAGHRAEADSILAELTERFGDVAAYNIAYVLAHRGEIDRAFRWLDRAADRGDPGLSEIFVEPEFDALKDDPRWPAFLERIGKSPEDLAAIEFEMNLPEA